jgi:hypothetical protein
MDHDAMLAAARRRCAPEIRLRSVPSLARRVAANSMRRLSHGSKRLT